MKPINKILVNTLSMYSQTAIAVIFGLFSTRFVLSGLGVSDFGIYGLIGSIVMWLSFLNLSLSSATQRFLSFNREKQNFQDVFSSSIAIHFCIGIIFILGIEITGFFFLDKLNISADRMRAAHILLHLGAVSSFFSIICTPYLALINAKENMYFFAICSMAMSACKFILALTLAYITFDRLIFYAFVLCLLQMLNLAVMIIFCKIKYNNMQFIFKKCKTDMIKKMLAFSGWNLVESSTGIVKFQGMPVMLNLFFNTTINASYNIANTVLSHISSFSWNLFLAVSPQIVSGIAENNAERAKKLAISSCKFSFFLVSLFSIPLLLNMDYVLKIWLGNVPEYVSTFCFIAILIEMLNNLARGLGILVEGKGNISFFKISMGMANLIAFPIAYILLKSGNSPNSVFVGLLSSSVAVIIIRCFFACAHVDFPLKIYAIEMAKILLLVLSVFIFMFYFSKNINFYGLKQLILFSVLPIASMIFGFWFCLNSAEKEFVKKIKAKFTRKRNER